jgi:hypothetical protein
MSVSIRCLLSVLVVGLLSPGAVATAGQHIDVNCDSGQKLARAVRRAAPGTSIRVHGTCNERVVIVTDRITLDGQGSAVLDGTGVVPSDQEFNGLLTIDGARGVVIRRFTVRNSAGEGILVRNGAAVSVIGTLAQNNGFTGIAVVDNSSLHLQDAQMTQNLFGLDAVNASAIVLEGSIAITDNVASGLTASGNSAVELRPAKLNASNNGAFGIALDSAWMAIPGFETARGSSITASNNGLCGLGAGGGGKLFVGGTPISSGTGVNVITASGNADCGIWLPGDGSVVSPFGAAKFVLQNNQVGLRIGDNSAVFIVGGLTITKNSQYGVLADAAAASTLVNIPPNPSSIGGNTTDVSLGFGSRVTFNGAPFVASALVCDGTVLTRGTHTCP